ncbi:MAG: hypothetical protein ACI9DJ_000536 [Algoriphagus sp.]|jgi:hypothetical protein
MLSQIYMKKILSLIGLLSLLSCSGGGGTLFERLDETKTGIDFVNRIAETDELNVLVYEYFYNGGGVAAADLNNDGLIDLYFTANLGSDKVYQNLGDLKFEDKTSNSGITWNKEWKTGVTVVDINEDGLNDIYVSVSGNEESPILRKNKLYINQGNFVFEEQAAKYGLDCNSFTTQTAFFDFDKDGDLDAYVMNHNVKDFKRFDVEAIHFMRDEFAGDKLFRNDNGFFNDVSKEAGIKGNPIGFGLGMHIADLNDDNWPDIYISNDYLEGDYLYINNQDGTFTDNIKDMVDHTSYFSMGNDVADINNDGLPDIFTSDMLPEDNKRQKLLFGPDKYEAYLNMLQNDFHPEVMRNMLHINEGTGRYAEMGQLAGLSNTDWSWSPLLADFDNDGLNDMFISNGYVRDYTNNDFVKFYSEQRSEGNDNVLDIINQMPSTKLANYVFKNNGNQRFTNVQKAWGFEDKIVSNGAIYADLDNDGDLEIITNSINEAAGIFENKSQGQNFLKISLSGESAEIINAKIRFEAAGKVFYREFSPNHGFQSAYFGPQHFGLGAISAIENLTVIYPNGETQLIENPAINSLLKVAYQPNGEFTSVEERALFEQEDFQEIDHAQMAINDFNRQLLLPWMYSYQGPCMTKGDVNDDGIEDFYLGGGKGSAGKLMLGTKKGTYLSSNESVFKAWELSTDVDAHFFDAEGDGDLDLYVVGGGYEYLANDLLLQNKLYLNDGKGNFTKDDVSFPSDLFADGCVEVFDFDNDGDQDVFVGGFVQPGNYPQANPSRLYLNDGGKFSKMENEIFKNLGLIKSAVSTDYNDDGLLDLVISGEWTAIKVLKNTGNGFQEDKSAIPNLSGLWQSMFVEDLDGDGDQDLVVGNLGLNTQFCASKDEPLSLHLADFDGNGRQDPIISCFIQGKSYPAYSRDELLAHIAPLKRVYNSYESYSEATTEMLLENFKEVEPTIFTSNELSTVYFENIGSTFVQRELPVQIQASPVYAMLAMDVNEDGFMDLIVGGNNTHTRVRIGNISANHGQVFLNDGKGQFSYLPQSLSGLDLKGEVRSLKLVNGKLLVGRNTGSVLSYGKGVIQIQ